MIRAAWNLVRAADAWFTAWCVDKLVELNDFLQRHQR